MLYQPTRIIVNRRPSPSGLAEGCGNWVAEDDRQLVPRSVDRQSGTSLGYWEPIRYYRVVEGHCEGLNF